VPDPSLRRVTERGQRRPVGPVDLAGPNLQVVRS
jgi:hypothetical protein